MKKNRKRILSVLYLALVFSVTLILAFYLSRESKGLFSILGSLHAGWLFAAVGCMALYLFIESWAVWYITSFMYKKLGYFYIMKLDIIGNYYGALTPAAFGFQPSQIAYMKRDGVPVGISTFIQTIKLMAYEVVITILCIVFMAFKGVYFHQNNPQIFWLSIFGALINIFVICVMILAIVKQNGLKKLVMVITRFLAKIKIVKHLDKLRVTIENTLNDFHESAKYLKAYKGKVVISCGLTLIQWLLFFTIPFCLYNAFGLGLLNGQEGALDTISAFDEAITIIAMAGFLFLAVHFMPIPGSSGATEAGFGIFFGSFFFAKSAAAMLIWRLITYYSMIVLGFIVIFFDGVYRKRRNFSGGASTDSLIPRPLDNEMHTSHWPSSENPPSSADTNKTPE
jgi:uncharacterized protein (TIRG00374 family)